MRCDAVHQFGVLKSLLCPVNNDTNVIANFKQIFWMLGKTGYAEATPQPASRDLFMTSQNLVFVITG